MKQDASFTIELTMRAEEQHHFKRHIDLKSRLLRRCNHGRLGEMAADRFLLGGLISALNHGWKYRY